MLCCLEVLDYLEALEILVVLQKSIIPEFVHKVAVRGFAQKLLDILGDDVVLNVDEISNANAVERSGTLCVRD